MINFLSRIRHLREAIAESAIGALRSERRVRMRRLLHHPLFGGESSEPKSHVNSGNFGQRTSRTRMSRIAQRAPDRALQVPGSNGMQALDVAIFCSDLESMLASMRAGFAYDAAQSGNAIEGERVRHDSSASLENDVADAVRSLFRSVDA